MMRWGVIAGLLLIAAAPAAAQEPPQWRPVDAATGQIRDVEALEVLASDFPDSGSVRLRLLQAQLSEGEMDSVLVSLAWLKERGYVFSEAAQAQIPNLVGEAQAEAARALLLTQAGVIEASDLVATVPAEAGLIESVAARGADRFFFASSITQNAIFFTDFEGNWIEFAPEGASDLTGMGDDFTRQTAWVASGNVDGSEDDDPLFNGLIGFNQNFSAPILVQAPEGVVVSDIVVASNGTIYASDPIGGGLYRKTPGSEVLETLIEPGTLRSPQGLAVSEGGTQLYISDYRYGLAIVDTDNGTVSRLDSDVPVLLDGTDGLWLRNGELIAVQNGTSPMRISAFTLSEDGTRIIAARVLEQAHSEWTEPLGGSISGDALIYVGTGQWDRYDKGELREGMEAIPTQIRRLPLGVAPD